MSLLLHREVRWQMLLTGVVAAAACNHIVGRLTRVYRQRLRAAHESLEQRVRERTAALEEANRALSTAAATERALRDELMLRDRMAAAGMVAAAVSHEIRSPLTVIRLAVEASNELVSASAAPELHELVTDISNSADHITTVLRDLSTIARPVDDPIGPIELAGIVDTAVRLASYKLGEGATLERGVIAAPPVEGNASRLVQLIMNLLHNAARATRPDVPNRIRISTRTLDERVVITISDTGTGMTAETRDRLFEPFFTTGRTTGGTGLGLTICRSLVERMGGSIEIDSELGVGTRISVTLRRAQATSSHVVTSAAA